MKLITGSVFILNAVIFFFQALTKNLFPPLLIPLRETFLIDNAQAGLLVTLVFLGYALARYPSGILADLYGCTRTLLLGSIMMSISFLVVAASPNYKVMAIMTFLLGVSSGIYVTAGYTLAVIIGSRERAATATAAFESFGILAGLVSPLLVTFFVIYLDWYWLFVLSGLLLALFTILFIRIRGQSHDFEKQYAITNGVQVEGEDTTVSSKPGNSGNDNIWDKVYSSLGIFREPGIRSLLIWSTLVGGFGALSGTGISSFIPTFLVEDKGFSFEVANRLYIILAVAGFSAKIATGWLADRFGNILVLSVNLSLSIITFILLAFVKSNILLVIILALVGALFFNTNTLINSYVIRSMPHRYLGAGFGIFCTAYTAIYSMGPYMTGLLSNQFGLSRAIQISAFGAVLALVLIITSKRFVERNFLSVTNSD
ncbi:MAG: MFS transporter [Bacillota bacterium]|nr:MFS transporter [Bacillota bacterium]